MAITTILMHCDTSPSTRGLRRTKFPRPAATGSRLDGRQTQQSSPGRFGNRGRTGQTDERREDQARYRSTGLHDGDPPSDGRSEGPAAMKGATNELRPVQTTVSGRVLPRFSTMRTIVALCLREVTTSNGDTAGGYMWSVVSPVIGIIGLSYIFSAGFRTPPLGENFAIFYATGLLPFTMFRSVCGRVEFSIRASRQLLNYPRVTVFDVLISKFIMATITQAAISALVLAFILYFYQPDTTFHIVQILQSFIVAALMGFGFGVMNCAVKTKLPLWEMLWNFVSKPLLLVSGVIILVESLPRPYSEWLLWNPLVHITGRMREAFYVDYVGSYTDLRFPLEIALVSAFIGMAGIKLFARELLDT
ncbi:ABC transporter permease [uncultured Paracoccus sp.]|uniref:ABC transporter permease n=1 Tax=uncultured Paracoccus sp. TaxID=189685 RepID=UPI0026196807|nr:ABC transporter permease [uncultured Paracoccus sp.]